MEKIGLVINELILHQSLGIFKRSVVLDRGLTPKISIKNTQILGILFLHSNVKSNRILSSPTLESGIDVPFPRLFIFRKFVAIDHFLRNKKFQWKVVAEYYFWKPYVHFRPLYTLCLPWKISSQHPNLFAPPFPPDLRDGRTQMNLIETLWWSHSPLLVHPAPLLGPSVDIL